LSERNCTETRNKHTYIITNVQIHVSKMNISVGFWRACSSESAVSW